MHRTAAVFLGMGLVGLGAGSAPQAKPAPAPVRVPALVGFDALQARLGETAGRLRLLDARPKADYDKGHIPGAVWVDIKAAESLAARPGGLTDRAAWQSWVDPLDLTPAMDVLVYDGGRQLDAARLWWLLSYLGMDNVGLVNGNFPLWKREGRPVTDKPDHVPAIPREAKVDVHFRPGWHATRAQVLAALEAKDAAIVDARSQGEHTGAVAKSKRAGRIPTACHVEWSTLVDADGRFLDEATLRQRFAALGARPGAPVITHCQGGGRASVDAFVLRRLGYDARNYYLGWSDWGNVEETPVEKP